MTSQKPRNASEGPNPPRCNAPVPPALSGHLGAFKCRLVVNDRGYHTGHHKAHHLVSGVGKIIWRWRNTNPAPPEITLPPARIERSPILGS